MSKVSITRSLLDDLATSISAKSGEPVPMTLAEMKDAVDGIQTGGTLITKNITSNGTYDAEDDNADGYSSVNVNVPTPTLQTKSVSITPSETAQSQTVTPDSGYGGLDEVDVNVGAISPTYVGSGITRRSSSDLTASGATVTVPSGYYEAQASKAVASGTAGTPTATKGTVSNHSVSVTPSVTNTTGYITGGTKTGTAVTVSASELVSGSETKTANGTYDVTNLASLVVNVSGGGGSTAEKKQVNFIDYDGTILYSYTAEEAQALTELPANPSHSGLIAQGWNWSLANIKSQLTNVGGDVGVGQMYETESGKTEIDINVDNPDFLSPYLAIAVNGTATIDWGDGTATDTVTGTSYAALKFTPHVYATTGRYTISIDGPIGFYCNSGNYCALLTDKASLSNRRTYSQYVEAIRCADGVYIGNNAFSNCYALQSITIPEGVANIANRAFQNCFALQSITIPNSMTRIGQYAFYSCYSLQSITIPDSVTSIESNAFSNCNALQSITIPDGVKSIGTQAFQNCYALQSITIPDGVTSIGNNAFQNCFSLQLITIPDGVTSIGNNAFYNCYSLQSITIPDGVTSIAASAFYGCCSIMEYHLLPTTPPTLANKNAFNGIVAGTIIYVPEGSLNAYKTATNWSTYASYMQEEPS